MGNQQPGRPLLGNGIPTRHNGVVVEKDFREARNFEDFLARLRNLIRNEVKVENENDVLALVRADNELSISWRQQVNHVLNLIFLPLGVQGRNNNPISAQTMTPICRAIEQSSNLISFTISDFSVGSVENMRLLGNAVSENPNLGVLRLRKCNIGDDGARMLANMLEGNRTLLVLSLEENRISSIGASEIAEALKNNAALTVLRLRQNHIGKIGGVAMLDAMKSNKTVSILDMSLQVNVPLNDQIGADLQLRLRFYAYKNAGSRFARTMYAESTQRKYFFEALSSNVEAPWRRTKLMVVGQGRAGKSATVRSLLNQSFNPNLASTIGAAVSQTGTSHDVDEKNASVWREPVKEKLQQENHFLVSHASTIAGNKYAGVDFDFTKPRSKRFSSLGIGRKRRRSSAQSGFNTEKKQTFFSRMLDPIYSLLDAFFDDEEGSAESLLSTEEIQNLFNYKLVPTGGRSLELSIWDYGGQRVFYGLHHLFLTKHGVYMLVFDMREALKGDEECFSTIRFWLKNINMHAVGAPVLLVGTFLDAVSPDSRSEESAKSEVDKVIRGLAGDLIENAVENLRDGLCYFPISNENPNGADVHIRQAVEMAAISQNLYNVVPLKWLRCLDRMMSKAANVSAPFLVLSEFQQIAHSCKIRSESEIQEMLDLFNRMGIIIYLPATETLRNIVTLDPSWMIDAVSKIIRDEQLHMFSGEGLEEVGLEEDAQLLFKKALASRDLVEYLWGSEQTNVLLDLLRETLLLSDWRYGSSNGKDAFYLIPSLLHSGSIAHDVGETAICIVDFSESFLPYGVFERLICLSCANSTSSNQPILHRASAKIWLDDQPNSWIILEHEEDSDRLILRTARQSNGGHYLRMLQSQLRKVSEQYMCSGLSGTFLFMDESEEIISLDKARSTKLAPWFDNETSELDESLSFQNIDKFIDQL